LNIGGTGELLQEAFSKKSGLKEFLQVVVQQVMESEVTQWVRADRYERASDRVGFRNGNKPRVGELALSVPQVRGCEPRTRTQAR